MKAILISIRPKWIAKILNGEKTIEVRKTAPKCELPVDVYIYCTKTIKPVSDYDWEEFTFNDLPRLGKIVAKFTLRKVEKIKPKVKLGLLLTYNTYETETLAINPLLDRCCLVYDELDSYLKGKIGYAWHISDLVIFDEPKEPRIHVPQSWCYVEEEKGKTK